ncbi:hypothetical protein GQ55_2G485000 [Panicum hallii var. hallii]|uniref:Uncharacterized protein n=1 Tax=Panicum hallii var. hallii TaxID=1504633 RepID=A0A2T7F0G0_9POAL|nr:hypothetical protein GQ55_2G485000 [Panicum hallii var. hallii]
MIELGFRAAKLRSCAALELCARPPASLSRPRRVPPPRAAACAPPLATGKREPPQARPTAVRGHLRTSAGRGRAGAATGTPRRRAGAPSSLIRPQPARRAPAAAPRGRAWDLRRTAGCSSMMQRELLKVKGSTLVLYGELAVAWLAGDDLRLRSQQASPDGVASGKHRHQPGCPAPPRMRWIRRQPRWIRRRDLVGAGLSPSPVVREESLQGKESH